MQDLKIKSQGLCVFCERPGVTKEHVWPEWTHALLPKNDKPQNLRASYAIDTGASVPATVEDKRLKQGEVQTLQVRVVCREHCNGGWMSRWETAIKPILTPLIKGEATKLDIEAQQLLAAWITKTAMMFEFADHKRVVSNLFQRQFLMETGEPPSGWKIWIASYQGEIWKTRAVRITTALTVENGNARAIDKKLQPPMNTQAITFGIGRLLVQLISTTVPLLVFDIPSQFEPYTPQIWPFQKFLSWPTSHILNDADAGILSNGLARMLRNDPDFVETLPE